MEFVTYAVPDVLPDNSVTARFGIFADCVADIADTVAMSCKFNAAEK